MSLAGNGAVSKEGHDLWTERLSLAACLWSCTVPAIFLAAIVFRDVNLGWAGAVVSYVVILFACVVMCNWRVHGK